MLNILFIGDIFGSPGRQCVEKMAPVLRERLALDLIVANGENAAGGIGLTGRLARELLDYGVDVITTGNHVWKHADLIPVLKEDRRVLRPANYPPDAPGSGYIILKTKDGISAAVINLEGRLFMSALDDPFRNMDRIIEGPLKDVAVICVDFHGEATSEKQALARHADGRVSAVVGTHTHVQTADERILPQGTAYITDLGLTGPHDSVIGMDIDTAVTRIATQRPLRFKVAKGDPRLQGALVRVDENSGKAVEIIRVDEPLGQDP